MKRLTIEGDWKRDSDGFGPHWALRNGEGLVIAAVYDVAKPTVEDLPDPLPTEPGAVFWAYGAKAPSAHKPCRWMVVMDVEAEGKPDPARITYISQRYQEWSPSEAERYGLCVLPDPDVTR